VPTFRLTGADFSEVEGKRTEITLSIKLELPRFASRSGVARLFLRPNLMERRKYIPPEVKERQQTVEFDYAYLDTDTIFYQLPANFSIEAAPPTFALREGGLDALATLHYKRQPSKLNAYGEQLALGLDKAPVAILKEAQGRIEKSTGIKRSISQIRAFLQQITIKRRKVGQIPSKANLKAQKRFKEEKLEPLTKQAQAALIRLFSVDASPFVPLPFWDYLYSLKRVFIRSASGRKRFNVLGALDVVNQTLISVCNETYITATTVCQLLEMLTMQYTTAPIYLILDNARYQRCALVEATAAALGIHLVFLEQHSFRAVFSPGKLRDSFVVDKNCLNEWCILIIFK
jgi:transposase